MVISKKKVTIDKTHPELLKEWDYSKNGSKLPEHYTHGSNVKIHWICPKGHSYLTTIVDRVRGKECKICHQNSLKTPWVKIVNTIEGYGGKVLSKESDYNNQKSIIKYKCDKGHIQERTWSDISQSKIGKKGKRTRWCSECTGMSGPDIEDIKKIASIRGGKLLSKSIVNSKLKLDWECANKHTFSNTYNNIKNGQWCPTCNGNIGEEISRAIFESIFKTKFPRKRVKWIKVNAYRELDGYCEELKIAFEYNGYQHYKYVKHYDKGNKELIKERKLRDQEKNKACIEKDITLITIKDTIARENLFDEIMKQCLKYKLPVKNPKKIDYKTLKGIYPLHLEEMQKIAKKKGGKCLSEVYIDSKTSLLWECAEGHTWPQIPAYIRKGQWCPHCRGTFGKNKDEILNYINSRNGRLLSDINEYKNRTSNLKIECEFKHTWTTSWSSLRTSWCPKCAGFETYTIEDFKAIAKKRGGECLSKVYHDLNTNLNWQCSKGHKWPATGKNIKYNNSWCPYCAPNKKKDLSFCKKIAEKFGGKCISESYIGYKVKMEWECAKGHTWPSTLDNIINKGNWCPACCDFEKKQKRLKRMQDKARLKGGKCLSTEYFDHLTELEFICKEGHRFKITPKNIDRDSWCKECRKASVTK